MALIDKVSDLPQSSEQEVVRILTFYNIKFLKAKVKSTDFRLYFS